MAISARLGKTFFPNGFELYFENQGQRVAVTLFQHQQRVAESILDLHDVKQIEYKNLSPGEKEIVDQFLRSFQIDPSSASERPFTAGEEGSASLEEGRVLEPIGGLIALLSEQTGKEQRALAD